MKVYYKITNSSEYHHDYQYHDGLNILNDEFSPNNFGPGGFSYTNAKCIINYLDFGTNLRLVAVPDNLNLKTFKISNGKEVYWRSNQIFLGQKMPLSDPATFQYLEKRKAPILKKKVVIWVAKMGYLDVMKYLVEKGADVRCRNDEPLKVAAGSGHIPMIEYLLTIHKISIHVGADAPLRRAAMSGHTLMVKWLWLHDADITTVENEALRFSVLTKDLDLVKFLLDAGADLSVRDHITFRWAIRSGCVPMARLILAYGGKIDIINSDILSNLIDDNHAEMVKFVTDLHEFTSAELALAARKAKSKSMRRLIQGITRQAAHGQSQAISYL